jgi:uncharacterized Zn finger protein
MQTEILCPVCGNDDESNFIFRKIERFYFPIMKCKNCKYSIKYYKVDETRPFIFIEIVKEENKCK